MTKVRKAIGMIGLNLALAGVYTAVGLFSLLLGQLTGLASPVWPAAGIAFAAIYHRGWVLLPGVLLGSFAINTLTLLDSRATEVSTTVAVALAIAAGAALQAFISATVVRRFIGPRPSLSHGGQVLGFLLVAGPIFGVINPTIGVSAQLAAGLLSPDQVALGWLTWWVGDSIGVMVFAPLVLMLLPGWAEIWRGRRWRIAVPSVITVAILSVLFYQSALQQNRQLEEETLTLAAIARGDLTQSLLQHQEVLEGLGSYFNASESVTEDEFRAFTQSSLARFPNLQALSWNPRVTQAELEDFEAAQRQADGRGNFTVTERNESGDLQPVEGGADHTVITYIEPMENNAAALGFDIGSDPIRAEAINAARDTGETRATAPVDLVQDQDTQTGMLALLPIYEGVITPKTIAERRADFRGVAVGVYRLEDLLNDTFDDPRWDDEQLELIDITPGASSELIAIRPAVNDPTVDLAVADARTAIGDPIEIYGRTWQLAVTPTSGPLAAGSRPTAPSFLISGLLIIGLMQALLLLVTGQERQARRETERSSLEARTDSLTGLVNRREFLRLLELTCKQAKEDGHTSVLMYLDLDEFKAVNDRGNHDAGDRLLRDIADVFQDNVRRGDVVARLGGDEFGIILANCDQEMALAIAHNLVAAVDQTSVPSGRRLLSTGVSIGLAVIAPPPDTTEGNPHNTQQCQDVLKRADAACYRAKRAGKGQVRVSEQPDISPTVADPDLR